MKILLFALNHSPELTGIGKYQGEMAEWLVARGHQVRVLTAPPYYPAWKISPGYSAWWYRREILSGARIYRVPLYVPAVPSGLKRLIHQASFALASIPVALWLAVTWRPDVVVVVEPPLAAAPIALLVALIAGARSHLHVQDFEVDAAFQLGLLRNPLLFRIFSAIERWILGRFSVASSISPRMCDRLLAKGVAKDFALLVPNWANVEDSDPATGPGQWRERLNLAPGVTLALYSGNLGRKQGVETVVAAAALLRERSDIVFLICGDGAAREEIVASAKGLDNIHFLPLQPLEEFRHLLIATDIHLLPQRAEAADLVMPSKLGNILASGRPVVAGAVAGTQVFEAVQGCGIAVPPDDADAFAEALARLADDAVHRAALGRTARERALELWSRNAILEKLELSLKGAA
jgi:colanic acid biosynthesis glycosyl transferase WcaI